MSKNGKTKPKMPGWIYRKVASNLLWEHYFELSSYEHDRELEKSYDELEEKLGIEEYLVVAASALNDEISGSWTSLPENIYDIMLYDDNPDLRLAEVRHDMDFAHITNGEKGEIVLEVIRAVHDRWVKNSTEEFWLIPHEMYRFMPLELIGHDRVIYYRDTYLEPLLSCLHLSVDNTYVERAYDCAQRVFFAQEGIKNRATLCSAIMNTDYYSLAESIKSTLEVDPTVVSKIANQVIEENPVLKGE